MRLKGLFGQPADSTFWQYKAYQHSCKDHPSEGVK